MCTKIKWSDTAFKFFSEASKHSLIIDTIVPYFYLKQTKNEFQEFVKAINSPDILQKLKKVNILDATHLRRHFHPEVEVTSHQSDWLLANKNVLSQLQVDFEIKSWTDVIKNDHFKHAQQIMCNEISDLEFRDIVTSEAAINSYKYGLDIAECREFILQECSYFFSCQGRINLVSSTEEAFKSLEYISKKYSLNVNHLLYAIPDQKSKSTSQKVGYKENSEITQADIESAVANFMKNEAVNLNFFVVDNNGKLVYSNFALEKLIDSNLCAEDIDRIAWLTTREVMLTGKTFVGEEVRDNGYVYLSMKAPLRISGEIKGAIGLSIDITDSKRIEIEKKRAADFEFLNRLQQIKINFQDEFTQFISQMAHDITSPLASLEVFSRNCNQLTLSQQFLLASITSSIKNIANDLLEKYKYNKRELDVSQKQIVLLLIPLIETVNQKRLQFSKTNVHIKLFYSEVEASVTFVNIAQSSFSRMISNLINNAVEACKERSTQDVGIVNVKFTTDNQNAVIEVSDNGMGMTKEMIDKITAYAPLKTTKSKGCGLGLSQVIESVKLYKGKIEVTSQAGSGTCFKITFPKLKQPKWMTYHINLSRESVVLIVDSGIGALSNVSRAFLDDKIFSFCNLQNFKTVEELGHYVCHLSKSEKEKILIIMEYVNMNSEPEEIIDVSFQNNFTNSSLVITDNCNNKKLQNFIEMSGGKMVPKCLLNNLKITFN